MAALIGEAVAGPTHAHLHRRAHQKKDVDWESLDWANMDVDWKSAYAAGQATSTAAPVAVATPTVAVAKAAATTAAAKSSAADTVSASSVVSDIADDLSSLLGGLIGASNPRSSFGTASAEEGQLGDFYRGNCGSPYGSNIIKVSSTSGYDFTNTFVNTGSKTMVINIWNKIGPDGQILSGSALAQRTPPSHLPFQQESPRLLLSKTTLKPLGLRLPLTLPLLAHTQPFGVRLSSVPRAVDSTTLRS